MTPPDETAGSPVEENLEAEGFSAKLAEFQANYQPDAEEPPEAPVAPAPVAELTPPAEPAGDKPEVAPVVEPDEIEFPEIGATKPVEPAVKPFDEAAFDAETEAEVKALDPKQAGAWKAVKERMKAAEKKAAALAETVVQAKPTPEIEAEIARLKAFEVEAEALRQRNQELLRANDQTAVRESDDFKRQVSAPLDEMEGIIRTMAAAAEIEPAALAAVIEETDIAKQDAMIDALGNKLSARALSRVERLADDYKAISVKERDMLAEAGRTIEQQRVARQAAEREEQGRKSVAFKASVADAFKQYAATVPGFTDSSGRLTDLGEAIMAKTQTVDIAALGPDDLGYLAYTANAMPEMRRELVKLRQENSVLRGSKPRGGVAPGAVVAPVRGDEDLAEDGMPMGLIERMKGVKFSPVGGA